MVGVSTPGFAFQGQHAVNAGESNVVPASGQIPSVSLSTPAAQSATLQDAVVQGVTVQDAGAQTITPQEAIAQTQADEGYDSLSEAVADQDASAALSQDLTCLAGAIYFESKGEPLSGQLAVAEVIINRAKSGRFGSSICGVVTQRGQFSFVRGGQIPAIANNRDYRTAVAVAQVALGDDWASPAPNALYFHARRVSPSWRMQKVAAIGNHVFYR